MPWSTMEAESERLSADLIVTNDRSKAVESGPPEMPKSTAAPEGIPTRRSAFRTVFSKTVMTSRGGRLPSLGLLPVVGVHYFFRPILYQQKHRISGFPDAFANERSVLAAGRTQDMLHYPSLVGRPADSYCKTHEVLGT